MTNIDVNKQALIFANFRLKDSDGSVKRQKRTAMSDLFHLPVVLSNEKTDGNICSIRSFK